MVERVQVPGCFVGGPLMAESLFAGLTKQALARLGRLRRRRLLQEGVPITSRGTLPLNVCILCSGSAVLCVPADGGTRVVREIEQNELLGITEAFSEFPFEYDVLTTAPCFLDCIKTSDFKAFVSTEPEVCFRLLRDLGTNLQNSYQAFSAPSTDEPGSSM